MSRTIAQIETDIDNQGVIKILEYLKDYLAKQLNIVITDIDGELQKIFTEVQGLDNIVSVIPKPLAPAATDPTTANDGDLFFNTTDKWFKYYHSGTWHNLAHLDTTIDAYTKAEADATFVKQTHLITPTITSQAGYLIMDDTEFTKASIGTRFTINLENIDTLGSPIGDSDRLFAGASISTTIKDNVYLKFKSKTNPTDTNIFDNYQTKELVVEKIKADELRIVQWIDKPLTPANRALSNLEQAGRDKIRQLADNEIFGIPNYDVWEGFVGATNGETTTSHRIKFNFTDDFDFSNYSLTVAHYVVITNGIRDIQIDSTGGTITLDDGVDYDYSRIYVSANTPGYVCLYFADDATRDNALNAGGLSTYKLKSITQDGFDGGVFKNNSQNLVSNDEVSKSLSYIGKNYKGAQYYGRSAIGSQSYGQGAIGVQDYGRSAIGSQSYGQGAIGVQDYGRSAIGAQSYGRSAIGEISIGYLSRNKLEIHFAEGYKAGSTSEMHYNRIEIKYDGATPCIYMDGAKQFTLREMVTAIKSVINTPGGGNPV